VLALLGIGLTGAAATLITFAVAGLMFAAVVGTAALAAVWTQRQRRPANEPASPGRSTSTSAPTAGRSR
jgi:hypothetical protein